MRARPGLEISREVHAGVGGRAGEAGAGPGQLKDRTLAPRGPQRELGGERAFLIGFEAHWQARAPPDRIEALTVARRGGDATAASTSIERERIDDDGPESLCSFDATIAKSTCR